MVGERGLLVLAFLLSTAIWGVALYPTPIWDTGADMHTDPGADADDQLTGERQPTHKHAYLFFLMDGERKNMTDSYLNQANWAHFHADNDVIHKHATNIRIGDVLVSLNINFTEDCLTFELDNESYCNDADHELRYMINGETVPMDEALEHDIQQDDNIVLFYGERNATVSEEYFEKELPSVYQPSYNEL